ncbi:MAG: FtsW/RodA/SpoVE family cell cycle protein [Acidobacteria bacterium]|nr:FtsW/RodA/SpoVE family cell cycle protein [Acidobacteriota bacterium]
MTNERVRIDWLMFAVAAGLALFGSAMVYSASAMIAMKETQSATQYTYFLKQFGFTTVGLVVMYAASRIDFSVYKRPAVVFGFLLVLREPDLGTTIVLCAIFASVYFAAGAKLLHLAPVAAALFVGGIAALIFAPWRMKRLAAFVDPCDPEYAASAGYQVCQSLYAIGSGGIFGEGFGRGEQKLFYLPYPYSDFIFSVVGEELGLVGTLGIVLAFAFLLWRGTRASLRVNDRFGMLLGFGLITGIVVQALFNISVVISLLPAKGIPLPFISYGGTSVVVTLFAVGVLLNISGNAGRESDAVLPRSDDRIYGPKRRARA